MVLSKAILSEGIFPLCILLFHLWGCFLCSLAAVDTHLLSWRANWLLMFLCKHHSTPGGHGIDVHSVPTPNTAVHSCDLTFIHIYAQVLIRPFFLTVFSFNSTWTYSSSHSNVPSLPHSTYLILRSICLSSDFPVVHLAFSKSIYNHGFWGLNSSPLSVL